MTDEQIKQNAEAYACPENSCLSDMEKERVMTHFIAGAHSRDEEIEELHQEVNELSQAYYGKCAEVDKLRNPWISVKDKLPQLNKICFGMRDGKMPRICMLVKKKNGECVFNTPNEEYEYPKGKITHWMPIPELKGEDL